MLFDGVIFRENVRPAFVSLKINEAFYRRGEGRPTWYNLVQFRLNLKPIMKGETKLMMMIHGLPGAINEGRKK